MAVLNALKVFFVDWIWKTFFVAWIHDAFFINIVCKKMKFDKWKGWIYLSPALVLLLIFTVWPMINTLLMAFNNGYKSGKVFDNYQFGIENFKFVLTNFDKRDGFLIALQNTMLLTVLTVPLSTLLALLIAVCLNAIKPLKRMLQTIFFLPYVTNSIAIGMVFMAMFNMVTHISNGQVIVDSPGIINNALGLFGVEPINWLNQSSKYIPNLTVMVIYIVWNALPFKILILLGGLQSVNKQYYEAAKVDSASKWRVFWRITVPMLSPMIAYVVITGFIGGFKEYSSVIGVFGETMHAPAAETTMMTMVGLIYQDLKDFYGNASASALILFVIIFIVTMINLYVSKKKTHY